VGFVPTMGYLHDGHTSLVRSAKENDQVVVSIFVNPTQFGPSEDYTAYPRPIEADLRAAEAAGVNLIFQPSAERMYPAGLQTAVEVGALAETLCGRYRPGHFRGVATVVAKLFNIVRPDVAVFGWKDAQQLILIRRMVEDLNLPIETIGVETVREADGLALSSRNAYLKPEERAAAPVLYEGLSAAREAARGGERDAAKLIAIARRIIARRPIVALQYLEAVSVSALRPIEIVEPGDAMIAVAAKLGSTRLIDNVRF
jgi:pantoate--beta-alanine ligase